LIEETGLYGKDKYQGLSEEEILDKFRKDALPEIITKIHSKQSPDRFLDRGNWTIWERKCSYISVKLVKMSHSNEKLLSAILKITNSCPLSCDYCYMRPHSSKSKIEVMSREIIKKTLSDYVTIAQHERGSGKDGRGMRLVWHGGEPLEVGIPFYRWICTTEHALVPESFSIANCLTTNGILIDHNWINFFRDSKFEVGISLDGPSLLHNSHRKFPDGQGSYEQVMKGIALMKEANLPFCILTVVSREMAEEPEAYFNFCINNGLKNIALLPYTTNHDWLSALDFARFLMRFFDLWYERDDPEFYVRDFENILSLIFGLKSNLCEYTDCFGKYLCMDTNGDTYMCDLFLGNKEMYLGNVMECSLIEMLDSRRYTDLKEIAIKNTVNCQKCKFFSICTGGCVYQHYIRQQTPTENNIYCLARKVLISHIFQKLQESEVGIIPASFKHD
jgi:uncharacterized protein